MNAFTRDCRPPAPGEVCFYDYVGRQHVYRISLDNLSGTFFAIPQMRRKPDEAVWYHDSQAPTMQATTAGAAMQRVTAWIDGIEADQQE